MTNEPKMTLAIGQIFESNNPRDIFRGAYHISSIGSEQAVLTHDTGLWTRVSLKLLYLDDKPRRSGWSIVR